ncbi:MAG: hypothetical protein E7058_10165, partial [Lentisphaerae bacterium]|nr:hypothetical protein [Lentisphaerota bacterium]
MDNLQKKHHFESSGCSEDKSYDLISTEELFADTPLTYSVANKEEASGSTGIMLNTLWNQSGIIKIGNNTTITYNEYCPLDGSSHSLTGCTNTATAQIIYYYMEKFDLKLNLTLNADDAYTSSYNGKNIQIKADGSTPGTISFAQINAKLADYDLNSADDAAALLYACGVVQNASYSASATSTAWYKELFSRAGFVSCNNLYLSSSTTDYWGGSDGNGGYRISDAGYEVLIENLQAGRVVGTSYPGHALVIDGYDSVNDKFHINFGWGNSASTAWYSREEMYEQQYYHFVYDLMTEAQETLTVNDMDVYGTGTLVRALEMAKTIEGANIINFTAGIAGKKLTLPKSAYFYDKITVNDFNISLMTGATYGFYDGGSGEVDAAFKNFSGSLVVNNEYSYSYGLYFYKSKILSFEGNGALICAGSYAVNGNYEAGADKILASLQNSRKNNLEIEKFILDAKTNAFYASQNNDNITFDNRSLVIGNIYMSTGNDRLTVTGNSRVFGDISMGQGTDTITIDSTSSITGGIAGKNASVLLDFKLLAAANSKAMLTVTDNFTTIQNYFSISADISKAKAGIYTLITAADTASYTDRLANVSVSVTGTGGSNYKLSASGTNECQYAELIFENNSLKLSVTGYDSSDHTPPSIPENLHAAVYGNGAQLNWNDSTDNNRVNKYFIRYGKTSSLAGNGKAVTASETTLTDLSNGTYYFQVRAVDASGNYSEWSSVKSFVVNHTASPVMVLKNGLLQAAGKTLTGQRIGEQTSMTVAASGQAVSTHVSSGGLMKISGGTATCTTVSSGGSAVVSNSGCANDLTVKNGGNVSVYYLGSASGVTVSGGGQLIVSNAAIDNVNIQSGGKLNLNRGSAVNVRISSGAVVNSFIHNQAGSFSTLTSLTNVNDVSVSGYAYVYSGMRASQVDVNYGNRLWVYSGGTAVIKYNPWSGTITSSAGATVIRNQRDKNVYFGGNNHGIISCGNSIDSLNVHKGLSALIYSGGLVNRIDLTSGGSVIFSGGSAERVNISSGATVKQFAGTVNSWFIYNGATGSVYGSAKNVNVSGGYAYASGNNAVINNIGITSGSMTVSSGARVGYASVLGGTISISSGATLTGMRLAQQRANANIYSGASIGDITICDQASITVNSGVTVNSLTLNSLASAYLSGYVSKATVGSRSYLFLTSQCRLGQVTVKSGGRLYLNAGTFNHNIVMERGAVIVADKEINAQCDITINGNLELTTIGSGKLNMQHHTLTLDLRERFTTDAYMVDDLDLISNYKLTVAVSAAQASGDYELALGTENFTGAITIKCGNTSGSLSVGGSLTLGSCVFSLTADNSVYRGKLVLSVNNNATSVLPKVSSYTPGTWSTDWQQASEYARKNNKLIFACYGDPNRCGFAENMRDKLLEDPEFITFAKEHLVLLYETRPAGKTYGGSPAGYLLNADGSTLANKSGFGAGDYAEWMNWLKLNTDTLKKGVYIVSSGHEKDFVYSAAGPASNLTVNNDHMMYVNGTTLTGGLINGYTAIAYIRNGGIASKTDVRGSMAVLAGGTATHVQVNSIGYMSVYREGIASNTTMNWGSMGVADGGKAIGTVINSAASMFVHSGGTAEKTSVHRLMYLRGGKAVDTVLYSGATLYVSNGGYASNISVASRTSGYVRIYSGGKVSDMEVGSGARLYVSNGGTADRTDIYSGAYTYVYSGGTATNTSIDSSGKLFLSSGAVLGGEVDIESGAYVSAYSGAVVDFTVDGRNPGTSAMINNLSLINGAPTYTITVGDGSLSGTYDLARGAAKLRDAVISIGNKDTRFGTITVNGNAFEYNDTIYLLSLSGGNLQLDIEKDTPVQLYSSGTCVYTGKAVSNTYLASGNNNSMFISSGGIAGNTTIGNGGKMLVSKGGTANEVTINSNGLGFIYSGGTVNDATLNKGGVLNLYYGAKINSAKINTGGKINVSNGGAASSTVVSSGGKMAVSSGGKADNTIVDNFGSMYVYSGGVANGATVYYMGQLYVDNGAKLNNGIIRFGKTYISSGATASNTHVSSGGLVFVSSGGKMETATVSSGGWIHLYYGGFANNATINGFGRFYVSNAASANKVTINSNGLGFIYAGGKMNNASIKPGGAIHVYGGGTANSATVIGGKAFVYQNGQISGTLLQSSGTALVSNGGKAVNTTVGYNGSMHLYNGAAASNTTVNYLGRFTLATGAEATGTTIKFGKVFVASGATVNRTTVSSGGLIFVSSGGTMETAAVSSGGWIHLYYGGYANNATVNGYGRFYVSNAASANKTTVNSNGLIFVYAGGKMNNATVKTGGLAHIYGGAQANTAALNGGKLFAYQGAKINKATLSAGGMLYISSGAAVNSASTQNMGKIYVSSGADISNGTIGSNGIIFAYKGAAMDNTTVQTKGGMHLYTGATHRGLLQIWSGATVSAYSGSTIDFTISR